MKRHKKLWIALGVVIVLMIACAAGGDDGSSQSDTSAEEEGETMGNQILNSNVSEIPIMNGSQTEQIGTAGTIVTSKDALNTFSYAEIKSAGEEISQMLTDKGYNYFLITFGDDTGILINLDSGFDLASYGLIEDDSLSKTYSTVRDEGTYFTLVGDDGQPITDTTDPTGINGLE